MTHEADPTQPYDYDEDLKTLALMTNRLETYVRGTEIYGNEGMFSSGYPAVTIGGILLRMRRLNALREFIGKTKQTTLDASILQHDNVFQEWRAHYEAKILAEAKSRLDRLQQFIEEYEENPEAYTIAFEPEQMRRTIIQEIIYMLHRINLQDDDVAKTVTTVDTQLKDIVETSDFQWHPSLETVYSSEEFWWLYSTLKTDSNA